MIDARTQLVGLIGWPVEHSLSPAFSALSLNWGYVPLPVRPGLIEDAISGLAALGFRGANVTIPYKEAVIPFLQRLSSEAESIRAVNTIVVEEDGTLIGHNTDSSGFIATLRDVGFDPKGRSAVVCGAGGAARAAVHGLLEAGVKEITVLNRNLERAEELISAFVDAPVHAGRLSPESSTSCTTPLQRNSCSRHARAERGESQALRCSCIRGQQHSSSGSETARPLKRCALH